VLTETLRRLERDGLISRTAGSGPVPSVEYALTDHGHGAWPVIEAMIDWGRQQLTARESRVEAVRCAQGGALICRVPPVIMRDGRARLAARVRLAVCQARPVRPGLGAEFLLRIGVRGLEPGTSLKAIIDRVTAAMQCDDSDGVREAATGLSALLGVDADELLVLVAANDAPLGSRSQSSPQSKETLSTLDGASEVRVTRTDHCRLDVLITRGVVQAGSSAPSHTRISRHGSSVPPDSSRARSSARWK
jgi:hypothetical protein